MIAYGRQQVTAEDIEAVTRVLQSDFLTQGPEVGLFEEAFAQVVGCPHAVAVSHGTAALHAAMLAGGIGPGDRVLVPAVSFVASANCARFVGAEVEFCDIDPDTATMSVEDAERRLAAAAAAGKPFRGLVTVDLNGQPADMAAFLALKERFAPLLWIQDACHSLGATWTDAAGRVWRVGEHPGVDMAVFSFHPVKHITTGEGGMIVTSAADLDRRLRLFRSHGIVRDEAAFAYPDEAFAAPGQANPWYYEMQVLGFNFRMTDFQAALGRSQLQRLQAIIRRRQEIVAGYHQALRDVPNLSFPAVRAGVGHAWHLAVILVDFAARGLSRGQFMTRLRTRDIGTQVHYLPIPMMPYYAETAPMMQFPAAERYYRRALSIPCFPSLTDEQAAQVITAIREELS